MDIELPALVEAFLNIQHQPVTPIEYRLYYDESGKPLFMSSSGEPDGKYIIIDRETYERSDYQHLRVVDGNLTRIDDDLTHYQYLKKGFPGFRVVKNHAGIILKEKETYHQEETYGFENH